MSVLLCDGIADSLHRLREPVDLSYRRAGVDVAGADGVLPVELGARGGVVLMDEDRRGLTALFWSNVNPYGTFRLDMDARLDLGLAVARTSADAATRSASELR
jgi:hypothetical protein